MRARARRDSQAAVERPLVGAAVLALGEVGARVPCPTDRGGVGAHELAPYIRAQINKPMVPAQTTIVTTSPTGVRSVFEVVGHASCQASRQIRVEPTASMAGKRASIRRNICKQML